MTDSAYVGANVRHAYPGISDRPAPGPIQGPQPADRVLNSDLTARDVSVEFFGLLNVLLQPSIMSAPTGISVSPELSSAFSDAVASPETRFLKISIKNGL